MDDGNIPEEPPTLVVQVFRDWTRKRWRRVCLAALAVLLVLGLFGGAWLRTLRSGAAPNAALDVDLPFDLGVVRAHAAAQAFRAPPPFVDARDPLPPPSFAMPLAGPFRQRVGWFDPEEARAEHALEAHAGALTELVVEGLSVGDARGAIASAVPAETLAFAHARGLRVLERLENVRDGVTHAEDMTAIGRDGARTATFVAALAAQLAKDGAGGVVIELGDDPAEGSADARAAVLRAARARLAKDGRSLAIAVRLGVDPAGLEAVAALADRVYVRARLEPEDLTAQGPVAPRIWLRDALDKIVAIVPRERLVVILPTHGAGWPVRATDLTLAGPPRVMSWAETIARCRLAGVRPRWDMASGNLLVALAGPNGVASAVTVRAEPDDTRDVALVTWIADAVTFVDQAALLRARGIPGIGIEDLGGEDPRVWDAIATSGSLSDAALARIPRADEWESVGEGVELRVLNEERDGKATVHVGPDGTTSEVYDALPASITVVHRGRPRPKTVSLTFDDGPDPEFTPKVLDVLRRHGVSASFFLIGTRVEHDPELVERIAREGHEIGNHSFSHVDLSRIAERRADLELRSTDLLFDATVGRSSILFRPPFRADDVPSDLEDLASIVTGQRNGMLTVGSTVDPRDWDDASTPAIIETVISRVEHDGSGVVLLHDGGGDRSRTVAALDPIIVTLKERGYQFVQLHDVLGSGSLPAVNPPVTKHFEQHVGKLGWWAGTWALRALRFVAMVALLLCLLRVGSLVLCTVLDLRLHGRSGKAKGVLAGRQAVSVVVPAYNEVKVIERTVRSVLDSEGVDVEVIVLDDGSKDATGDLVAQRFLRDPRVRLVRLRNGGKAAALNLGFREAAHPIVVALDADTIFLPSTIRELVAKFSDARVGAVAGRAVVGNTKSAISRWQALEYVIGQAVERRAWHLLGLVSVVPGAVGAWRRDAVLEAGGFARDTLAEDSDLTIDLQVRGWRVEYAPEAIALTEAPESARALIKQRFRWSYGVLQALWKHRRAALRPNASNRAVGFLLLPVVFISHFATPLLAPAADLAAALAIYVGYSGAVVPYAIATLLADMALTAFAMRLDRAPASLAYDWLVNRAVYRWLLFIPLVKAALAALRGGAVGWGKLSRKGTVRLKPEAA